MYKDLLEREEAKHDAAIKAVHDTTTAPSLQAESTSKEPSEAQLAKQLGAEVNEEGRVTDKRQLLQAGLNVKPKQKPIIEDAPGKRGPLPGSSAVALHGRGNAKNAMRERQSRMIEEQLQEAAKRAANDADVEAEAVRRAAKSRKTETEVSSAKERYLQRKRDAAAAVAKEAAGGS